MDNDDHAASEGKAWGAPLLRLDAAWQRFEAFLCGAVLVAEIASLTLWVILRGLATDTIPGGDAGGLVSRAIVSMTALGIAAHLATRKRGVVAHRAAVSAAIVAGMALGPAWAHVGCAWSSNLLNWLQNASVLMLIGGLRGLATRLTLWVSLLGASLASSRGKHIHVDVLLRYIPAVLRKGVTVACLAAASAMCAVGAVGFTDYISIAMFQVNAEEPCPGHPDKSCDVSVHEKTAAMKKAVSADFFLLGRQIALDVRSLPHVIAGTPYDHWMTPAAWNAWIDSADWTAHFPKAAVDAQRADPSMAGLARAPAVQVPGGGDARGLLARELDFVFPVGLLFIALKFVIRILLVLSGHVATEVEADLEDDGLSHDREEHDREVAAAAGEVSA